MSDIVGGQTTVIDGRLRVGEGTVHATLTTIGSAVPETHIQLYFNAKQYSYDLSGFYDPLAGSYIPDALDLGVHDVTAVELELPW